MPTPTARALDHEAHANDTHGGKAAQARAEKPKRARTRPTAKSVQRASAPPTREPSVANVALVQAKKSASPLLIGAGIGAALALSVVALRRPERRPTVALFASPNSTFFNAMVKTVAFAVEQTAKKGSLRGLVARAVGKAVA